MTQEQGLGAQQEPTELDVGERLDAAILAYARAPRGGDAKEGTDLMAAAMDAVTFIRRRGGV